MDISAFVMVLTFASSFLEGKGKLYIYIYFFFMEDCHSFHIGARLLEMMEIGVFKLKRC